MYAIIFCFLFFGKMGRESMGEYEENNKNEIIHLCGTDADTNKSKVFWFSEFISFRKKSRNLLKLIYEVRI